MSRIVFRVSSLIAALISQVIKMPSTQERQNENHELFKVLGYGAGAIGLPGIDGAIDCTHVRLTHTRFQNLDEIYRNRKGYFSLNVQVCSSLFKMNNNYALVNIFKKIHFINKTENYHNVEMT